MDLIINSNGLEKKVLSSNNYQFLGHEDSGFMSIFLDYNGL